MGLGMAGIPPSGSLKTGNEGDMQRLVADASRSTSDSDSEVDASVTLDRRVRT